MTTAARRRAHEDGPYLNRTVRKLADQPGEDRCALLRRAIAASKGALTTRTADAFPREHAGASHNLAIMRGRYEAAGCAPAIEAIEPAS